jgi:hypothetical protein
MMHFVSNNFTLFPHKSGIQGVHPRILGFDEDS